MKTNSLKNKIEDLTTEMLIEIFKKLESNNSEESNIINQLIMDELELRLPEDNFCNLLDEVYEY